MRAGHLDRERASISSFGAAASIIASAAFMESSEIPPQGEREADCIWKSEAFTKSLDIVPRAFFSRRHQISPSPSGDVLALSCHPPENLDTDRRRAVPQRRAWVRRSAYSSSAYTPDANAFTNERSHLRSSIALPVQFPLRKLPFSVPRGAPGLKPPCKRHRLRPWMADVGTPHQRGS